MSGRGTPFNVASPTLHASILFTIFAFAAILVMSVIFKVEVVAQGQGRVVPVGRVQIVQPEFDGRIAAIHVRNGAAVSAGDVLIELDPTDAIAELGTITAEQARLRIEMARLVAMVSALEFDFNDPRFLGRALAEFAIAEDLAAHPFVHEQRALMAADLKDLLASLAQIDARVEANRRSEDVTTANIGRVDAALEIQAERLANSERLLQQGTTSRSAFLDVQQAFIELEREREVYLRELDQKYAERAALDSERRSVVANQRSVSLTRKAEVDSRLAALAEAERTARRRVHATTLRAPASGIVDQLAVYTIGGVAEAGDELLHIVPTDAAVEIEATFANQDIGFLEVGQHANIRLDAYPSERFGFVPGSVSDIAADSTEVTEGSWGFIVRLTPKQPYLETGVDRLPLRPGMTARIDVTTDERRIITYFFAPIVRTLEDAMGER